jgi:orotate phosphoribosyltransferase
MWCLSAFRPWARPKAVGGLTLGADPIATAAAFASYLKGTPLEAFVVRKEPKRYGTMRQIEGCVEAPDPVVILEDVLTTGGSARKAVEAARREGLKVLAVLVLLDRQEGGAEAIKALGLPLYSIFTAEEFF